MIHWVASQLYIGKPLYEQYNHRRPAHESRGDSLHDV